MIHLRMAAWQRVLLGVALTLVCSSPAWTQAVLTSAELYQVQNDVALNRQNRGTWQPAARGDRMMPQDALRTGAASRAEVIFNDGTLVRTGAGTTFYFPAGQRHFELINGTTLIMIRPGLGASRITTPQAVITARGTALFVQHDSAKNASTVGVLTDSPAGPVTVTDASGASVQLNAGQMVSVANGVMGLIENFIMPMFYETVDLATGLAPGQEAFVRQQSDAVQTTLNAVRAESLPPLNNQVAWMSGLCQQGIGTVDQILQQTPLLQWLLPSTIPTEQLTLQLPASDLLVIPLRSLSGMAWLTQFCRTRSKAEHDFSSLAAGSQPLTVQSSPDSLNGQSMPTRSHEIEKVWGDSDILAGLSGKKRHE